MANIARSGMNLFAQAACEALTTKGAAITTQKAASIELSARGALHSACARTQHVLARAGHGIQVVKERGPKFLMPALHRMSAMTTKAQGYTQVALDESQFEAKQTRLEAAEAVFEEVAAAKVAAFSEKGFLSSIALEASTKLSNSRFSLGVMPKIPINVSIPNVKVSLPQFSLSGFKLPAIKEEVVLDAAGVAVELGAGALELSHSVRLASVDALNVAKETKTTLTTALTAAHDALPEAIKSKIPSLVEQAQEHVVDAASNASTASLLQRLQDQRQAENEAMRAATARVLRPVLGDDTDRVINAGEVIANHYTEQTTERFNSAINRAFGYLRSMFRAIYSAIISRLRRSFI